LYQFGSLIDGFDIICLLSGAELLMWTYYVGSIDNSAAVYDCLLMGRFGPPFKVLGVKHDGDTTMDFEVFLNSFDGNFGGF
jgi:hypothetical protein